MGKKRRRGPNSGSVPELGVGGEGGLGEQFGAILGEGEVWERKCVERSKIVRIFLASADSSGSMDKSSPIFRALCFSVLVIDRRPSGGLTGKPV